MQPTEVVRELKRLREEFYGRYQESLKCWDVLRDYEDEDRVGKPCESEGTTPKEAVLDAFRRSSTIVSEMVAWATQFEAEHDEREFTMMFGNSADNLIKAYGTSDPTITAVKDELTGDVDMWFREEASEYYMNVANALIAQL